jgi:hypothetical protein
VDHKEKRDFSLRRPTPFTVVKGDEKNRPASFEMTGGGGGGYVGAKAPTPKASGHDVPCPYEGRAEGEKKQQIPRYARDDRAQDARFVAVPSIEQCTNIATIPPLRAVTFVWPWLTAKRAALRSG